MNGRRRFLGQVIVAAALTAAGASSRSVVFAEETGLGAIVRTIDPDPAKGTLMRFSSSDGAALVSGSREVRIPIDRIVRVEIEANGSRVTRNAALRSNDRRGVVVFDLVHGDWVLARPLSFDEGRCVLALPGGGEVTIPLDAIVAIVPVPAALPQSDGSTRSLFLASDSRGDDRILLSNGDVLRGFIQRVDADGLTVENGMGTVTVAYRMVVAARFASVPPAPPVQPHVRLHLGGGARLTCSSVDFSGGAFTATFVNGDLASIPRAGVARLDVIGGRWQSLSASQPLTYEHTPMLGLHWEYRRNGNVLGEPLQVAGRSYESGLGVHSRSRLSFELKGQFAEFVTRFGLDDSAGPLADVDVSILVDGSTRFHQEGVRPGLVSDVVRIDVRRSNRIELVVDFGKNGDIQDRFDWIEPGLIR